MECYCSCCEEGSHPSEIALCEAGPLIRHFLHTSVFGTKSEVHAALLLLRSHELGEIVNSQILITEVK